MGDLLKKKIYFRRVSQIIILYISNNARACNNSFKNQIGLVALFVDFNGYREKTCIMGLQCRPIWRMGSIEQRTNQDFPCHFENVQPF